MVAVIGRPNVVLGVDAQAVGMIEKAVAKLPQIFPVMVELHQHRFATLEDEDVTRRVKRDARDLAEILAVRELKEIQQHQHDRAPCVRGPKDFRQPGTAGFLGCGRYRFRKFAFILGCHPSLDRGNGLFRF